MKILITEPGRYIEQSKDAPEVGRAYNLEDATTGTGAQGRTFEALVMVYWKAGVHPKYGGCPYEEFRDQIKRTLGAGFAYYVYADIVDGKPKIYKVKKFDEIPDHVRQDPDMQDMIRGRLKSRAHYTKKELQKTIDALIDDMLAAGVANKKFDEILNGLEERKNAGNKV